MRCSVGSAMLGNGMLSLFLASVAAGSGFAVDEVALPLSRLRAITWVDGKARYKVIENRSPCVAAATWRNLQSIERQPLTFFIIRRPHTISQHLQ